MTMKDGEEETLQQVLWDLLGTQVNLCRQISCLTHERDAALADLEACRQELHERAVAHEQAARELGRKPLYLQLLDQANYKVDDLRAELHERAEAHEEAVRELFARQHLLCAQLAADARARRAESAALRAELLERAEAHDAIVALILGGET